jgi:hypothetical protein
MQAEVAEALFDLIDDVTRHGDVSRLGAFEHKLAGAKRLFRNDPNAYPNLKEFAEHAARFKELKAMNDEVPEGEPISDEEHNEENWLLDRSDILKERFKRYVPN